MTDPRAAQAPEPAPDAEAVRFGQSEPFSLGVEEELFLVNRVDGSLRNDGPALVAALGEDQLWGRIQNEVHACQVELITPVCATVEEAMASLGRLRTAVLDTGSGLIGSGTHPTALEGESQITDKQRYRYIREHLGDAIATPVGALHVHVGMPDDETAIRVFNGMRAHLPLLEALAANSPFRHSRDTGLACSRELTLRAWPRSGVLRELRDFEDFRTTTRRLSEVAQVPDYTFHWWRLRPHPRLGTVEIRTLDAQGSLKHAAGLVALIQALARHLAEAPPMPGPAPEILDEASFRAARDGVWATLPNATGRLLPVQTLLEQVIETVLASVRELGCEQPLEGLAALVQEGGGAGIQRSARAVGDMPGVLAALMRLADG